MESNHLAYDFEKSRGRIDDILGSPATFEDRDFIPRRAELTYTNGFYVRCSAVFVDIRGSSGLPEKYRRPTLARIYRAYLSEVVAALNGSAHCAEINIVGDAVSAVFDTPFKDNINTVFETAGVVSSVVDVLNCKLEKRQIDPIAVGIGLSWGRALMVKAGYNGSGINDVVWMGDVVNEASKLCAFGSKTSSDKRVMVSEDFYENLKEPYRDLLRWSALRGCYHGYVVRQDMDRWVTEKC